MKPGGMKFIVTIDTEEDDWNGGQSIGSPVTNVARVPDFQALCDRYEIRPTYLLTYPITQDSAAARLFRGLCMQGTCEIGVHCHPWNTPPFEEELTQANSMLCNLPADLQFKKIETLDRAVHEAVGVKPLSFRAGRWAYSAQIAQHLITLGYKVDTSVTPYMNWAHLYGPDFWEYPLHPHWIQLPNTQPPITNGTLLEIPATIGVLGWSSPLAEKIWKRISNGNLAVFKGAGLLAALGIMRKVWFSPEIVDGPTMISLITQLRRQGHHCFNMVFHSSSLKAGLTPFVQTPEEESRLLQRMEEVFRYVRSEGIRPVTLAEAGLDYE